ncbi:hypothetical protein H6F51_12575 [Cyanobacteria bacterium FACHB-DQ100]|uniref:hypothetical protein n=1 Tax=unclassified Leptolyngbya TaxID=2650499 RepID=UPI001680DDA2|nr:hypothetical protein [Cyanobacteria bacterium FACHB-DQ100]MBD2083205.1 hypothetical protein [Leptolyngbya sp. FACHB-17]
MNHTFLMEPGRWTLQGNWLERDGLPIAMKGKLIVAWSRDDWFTLITKLTFPQAPDREDMTLHYRGRLDQGDRRYTFVLQHSILGRIEGEGWVAPESLVQRHWVLGDRQRRSGFETLYRLSDDRYYLASTMLTGHALTNMMEATLERQAAPLT